MADMDRSNMGRSLKVAVIGAGPAGLVAARELLREGHRAVVYERQSRLGGTWVYDHQVESDPLGVDPNRNIVHSSLYFSLRTNLPRDLMSFSDYKFVIGEDGDQRNFPRHEEVLKFLENFAVDFGLVDLIRFNEEVVRVEQVDSTAGEWIVESRNCEMHSEEVFEAVVVCNGHGTEPRVAMLPGIEKWPGKQIHSHNYRASEPFQGQVVVVIGNGPSAQDISREIAAVAKEVHLSSRSPDVKVSKIIHSPNIWQHPKCALTIGRRTGFSTIGQVDCVFQDGKIAFQDGFSIEADTILYCTGYKYNFPFLKANGLVTVDDNRVGPLYKHVFPPQLAPTLSFLGIPVRIIVFSTLEFISKWVAKILSGKVTLPSQEEMLANVQEYYKHMKEMGIPKHQTHFLDPFEFDYVDWLAAQVGTTPLEDRLKNMFRQLAYTYISEKDGTLNRDR